jgi:hypothetical protein
MSGCDTRQLIAFAQDGEISAHGPLPVVVRVDHRDGSSSYHEVEIVGKKGETFQLVVGQHRMTVGR